MADDDNLTGLRGDARILEEARKRFIRCNTWESDARKWFRDDTKFANGDTRNTWQWPDILYSNRDGEHRPCLTVNRVRQHNLQIINDARQNKPSIKIRPTGGEASYESALAMQAVIRRIEYISKATVAYDTATKHQVEGGIGYVRLQTDYVSDRSFDQDIYIRRIKDPLAVFLDPDIREVDGSDAKFAFIFEDMTREEFNRRYPKYRNLVGQEGTAGDVPSIGRTTLGDIADWIDQDHIRVAEYFRRVGNRDTLIAYTNPNTGAQEVCKKSDIPTELRPFIDQILDDPETKTREIINQEVEWFLIAGDAIVDKGDWLGKYIPIARVIGEESIVDGKLDRKGHTRNLIDMQRMLNYNASAQVEYGALQTKTPWVGASAAFEGMEGWKDANVRNFAYLPFNHLDDAGDPIPPNAMPQRPQPPQPSELFQTGMQDAVMQMMQASGQFQSQFGEKENATSGKAIGERQRQGDNATYHFIDNLAIMVRHLGVMILDLIPKIYDTERVFEIMAEDGTPSRIKIDPTADRAFQRQQVEDQEAAASIFNPKVGEYDVQSDTGPNYATGRQEAWNAFVQIVTQSPDALAKIGDFMFKAADFPMADQIAQRFLRDIEHNAPWLIDDSAVGPMVKKLQADLANAQQMNGELLSKLAEDKLKMKGYAEKRDIDADNAETNRLKVMVDFMSKVMLTPQQHAQLEHELISQRHAHSLDLVTMANEAQLQNQQGDESKSSGGAGNGNYTGPVMSPHPLHAKNLKKGTHYVTPDGRHFIR